MKYLFKLGDGWTWSKIYFDLSSNAFIEERYHEEYLDTGTICDGESPIDDVELWERIIKEVNEEGVSHFIKIRGTAPQCSLGTGITIKEFREGLVSLKQQKPYHAYTYTKVDTVSVVHDEDKNIVGVIGKTDNFWFFIGTQKQGFCTQEETFEFALKKVKEYHDRRLKQDIAN